VTLSFQARSLEARPDQVSERTAGLLVVRLLTIEVALAGPVARSSLISRDGQLLVEE
jgi:hypothetical protein